MAESSEENFTLFFIKFAQHSVRAVDGKHAEWVLFRHGSLYVRTMLNNVETPENELIEQAKENLAEVEIVPGCSSGDCTIYSCDYENETIYGVIDTFAGIILVHPSINITNDIEELMHVRMNVLNDQQNPVVVTTYNSRQSCT